jgi:aerobic-type carbon monoxide dehydrogenase small subunit (CoxS/CutS family)
MSGDAAPGRLSGPGADGTPFELLVDGERVQAYPGETIATALLGAGRRTFGRTLGRDAPRGLYCVTGTCWECVVGLDGRRVRACMEPAAPGLRVATLPDRGDHPAASARSPEADADHD